MKSTDGERMSAAIMRDIELPRKQWLEAHVTASNFYISIISGECVLFLKGFEFASYGYYLVFGIIVGFIVAYLIADKIKKKYHFILVLFILNYIIFQLIYFDIFMDSVAGVFFLLSTRAFILFLILVNFFQTMNMTTGVLERGRVYTITAVSCIILTILLPFGIKSLEFNYFFNMYNIFYFIFITKMGTIKYSFFTPKTPLKAALNGDIARYMIILALFGFSEGLLSPDVFSIVTGFDVQFIGPLFLSIGLIVLGFVYDVHGRRNTLLIKIIAFSSFGFLYFFEELPLFGNFILRMFVALIVISIVSLFVIMGDISPPTAKVFLLTMIFLLISALVGMLLKEAWITVPGLAILPRFLAMFVLIVNTAIISNTRDIFIKAEKEWYESMITLFVIHESGIMLFYKRFEGDGRERNDGLLGPDLISAGLVGISNFVCEILKGRRFISGIENYSSKILLEKGERVIAALVVHQDLRILREKLKRFLNDFESNFKPISSELIVIGTDDIKVAEDMIGAHFKTKRDRGDATTHGDGGKVSVLETPSS